MGREPRTSKKNRADLGPWVISTPHRRWATLAAWEEAAGRVPGKCDRGQSGSWALETERKERVEGMQT